MWCCSACGSCRSRARSLISASTCCSRRTSRTRVPATPRGSATTRVHRCCLPSGSTTPWRSRRRRRGLARSVGFVGFSDGWQQLQASKRLDHTYARAENGNVAVTGEIDLVSCDGTFVMALGFGPTAMEAGQHARITLLEDFDETQAEYVRAWRAWHARLLRRRAATAPNPPLSGQCGGAADT